MNTRTRLGRWGASVLLVFLSGCATSAEKRARVLAAMPTTPFAGRLNVVCIEEPDTQEEARDLRETVERALAEALEAAGAFHHLEVRDAEVTPMDVTIDVAFKRPRWKNSGHDNYGVFLDLLSWSTIPPVSLFVRDVQYSIDLQAEVQIRMKESGVELDAAKRRYPEGTFSTSLVDRYGFAERPWPYLGCILIPPVVFSNATPDRIRSALLERYLLAFAAGQAERIKQALQPERLESEELIAMRCERFEGSGNAGKLILRISLPPDEHLTMLQVQINGAECPPPARGRDALVELSEKCATEAVTLPVEGLRLGEPNWVRVIARGYRPETMSFTFRVDVPASGPRNAEVASADG